MTETLCDDIHATFFSHIPDIGDRAQDVFDGIVDGVCFLLTDSQDDRLFAEQLLVAPPIPRRKLCTCPTLSVPPPLPLSSRYPCTNRVRVNADRSRDLDPD